MASACNISSRNWFPRPRPLDAPETSPATSTSFTGMSLEPLTQTEFLGLSSTPISSCTHLVLRWAMPTLGFIVVNGKSAMATLFMVAAAKKVDLPTLGFPRIPTITSIAPARRRGSKSPRALHAVRGRSSAPRSDNLDSLGRSVETARQGEAAITVETELWGRTQDHLSSPQRRPAVCRQPRDVVQKRPIRRHGGLPHPCLEERVPQR